MKFHPLIRTAFSQSVAMTCFVVFLGLMYASAPQLRQETSTASDDGSRLFVASAPRERAPSYDEEGKQEHNTDPASEPARPERFRPSSIRTDESRTGLEPPPEAQGRPSDRDTVAMPPEDLPLSYLMKFGDMEDFHSFLDDLQPSAVDTDVMSLIRIEGLPEDAAKMRRLLESYHMKPFLFNPERFNYLITGDMQLITDGESVRKYIARVGRYVRDERSNAAYRAMRDEMVRRARLEGGVREAFNGQAEFDRMKLGLASPQLTAFLRRLEADTVKQVARLTGRAVDREDISRIDCGFRDVHGAMVLVPHRAYIGSGGEAVDLWNGKRQ